MRTITIWKFNESGTISKYMLQKMAADNQLSMAAIGAMVVTYYTDAPVAEGELDMRAGGSIIKLHEELKVRCYIPTDEQCKIIEEGQS